MTLNNGNRTQMDRTVIYQNIVWEVELRKLWEKLLELPERGLPQKRVNSR